MPRPAHRFVFEHTRLHAPPHLPELRLYLADELTPIWEMTEAELDRAGLDPPFWAFAWAGGQALARYLLDHPGLVRGRAVLDVACGSGVVAVAARAAGAAAVRALDVDPFAVAATQLNAAANGVRVDVRAADVTATEPPAAGMVLAGDVCYEHAMSQRVLGWLRAAHRAGAQVLLGDPGRRYLPAGLVELAVYDVATMPAVEEREFARTRVLTFGS